MGPREEKCMKSNLSGAVSIFCGTNTDLNSTGVLEKTSDSL